MKYSIGFMKGVSLEICKDGVVTYRTSNKQRRRQDAALPFYSVSDEETAKLLITRLCNLTYSGDYWIHDFNGEIDDIERISDLFYKAEQTFKGRKVK